MRIQPMGGGLGRANVGRFQRETHIVSGEAPEASIGIRAAQIGVVWGSFGASPEDLLGAELRPVMHQFIARIMALGVV